MHSARRTLPLAFPAIANRLAGGWLIQLPDVIADIGYLVAYR